VKRSFHIQFLIVIIGLLHLSGFGQTPKKFNLLTDDLSMMLPPLETLIDSALKKNPFVKFRERQISVNKNKLKDQRSLWMKNFGVQTDVRYGTFDNFSTNTAEGQNPALLATRSVQLNYGAGAYMKFPIFDIVNRKNQINMAKSEVGQAEDMAKEQRNELRQQVIKQYNDLILKQKLVKIRSKYLETSRINMEMIEKEFQNGVITLSEYSRISEIYTTGESNFEIVKTDFITAFMLLEESIGFKLNLNIAIKPANENN